MTLVPVMDESDIMSWAIKEIYGTKYRVFSKLVDTHYGPEMFVMLWSPITQRILIGQECMSIGSICHMLLEETRNESF